MQGCIINKYILILKMKQYQYIIFHILFALEKILIDLLFSRLMLWQGVSICIVIAINYGLCVLPSITAQWEPRFWLGRR